MSVPVASRDRISVVFYTDAEEVGGAELSLGNLLSALPPRIEATVVGTSESVVASVAAFRPRASTLVLAPIRRFTHLAAMLEHFRALRRVRPDVLHVNVNATGGSPWAIAMGLAAPGVRVIVVEHLAHPIRRARRRALVKLLSTQLSAHVAVGQRAARDVARYLGRPERSVRTIHNGVPDVDLEALPRPSERSVVGSIGRLDRQKAYDVLVQALTLLPDVTAVVVGEGEERGRLVELAAWPRGRRPAASHRLERRAAAPPDDLRCIRASLALRGAPPRAHRGDARRRAGRGDRRGQRRRGCRRRLDRAARAAV